MPNAEAAAPAPSAPASTARTISYLTWTRSAGSKKAPEVKAGSVTVSGCGFSVRDAASEASLLRSWPSMAPPAPEFRPCNYSAKMNGPDSLLTGEEGHCRYHGSQKPATPDDRPDAIPGTRQNHVDIHDRVFWTPSAPERSRATSSASFSRSAVRNGARPAATTTNGSAGARSVHSAGRLTSSPSSPNTYTRSARQFRRRFTNSSSRTNHGWNR